MRIIVTGGCGFIGSNFVRHVLLNHPDDSITNVDALTYAGNLRNLADIEGHPRYRFVKADITDREAIHEIVAQGADAIVNFAAESHVDRSILDSTPFVRTNVLGTQVLLDAAVKHKVKRFLQVSTDEVYGSLGPVGRFTETSPLAPNSPYAASKAAADLLVKAFHTTFGLDAIITRCSNNYGPYQFPEKLIPLFITNALADQPLPIYGDGLYVRDWIYVLDHCAAVDLILRRGKGGEIYNIGAHNERTNLEITRAILAYLSKPESLIRFVKDRPAHDRRYAIDASKLMRELGWRPAFPFEQALHETIRWYIDHRDWWTAIKSGEYLKYYQQQYGNR